MKRETYRKLYARQAAFYKAHPRAMKALIFANFALTAAVFAAYALLCAFGFIGGSLADVLRIVGVPLLCLLTVSALRNLINRKRPYECADIRPLLHKNKSGRSFPSRHVASAFVIGTVLLRYAVWGGMPVLAAGLILGYIRFAAGLHYPSDLAAGALIGALFGLLAFL